VTVANGLTVRLTGSDGLFGGTDALAITLMRGESLVFSTDWTGARTTEIPVTNGNLVIL